MPEQREGGNIMNCNYEGANCKFCEIDCNENTPEGTAIPKSGASEIYRFKDSTEIIYRQEGGKTE